MTKKEKPTAEAASSSIVEKLIQNQYKRKEHEEQLIKKAAEWKKVLNGLGSTPDGQYFLSVLVKHAGIFSSDNDYNGVKLVQDKAAKEFYLKHIRPYLDKAIINSIE